MIKGTIYKITSPSGKIYIGQTKDLNKRLKVYQYLKSRLQKQPKLYNSFKKYGFDVHEVEILEDNIPMEINRDLLDEREVYWIKFYDSYNNGLNCNIGGCSNKGLSEEGRKNLRLSKLGNTNWKGKVHSLESRIKMSEIQKGRKVSEETKEKLRNFKPTEETRIKQSLAKKGKKQSPEHIEARRKGMIGHEVSEVTRQKISDSQKGKSRKGNKNN